ncbi:uncharacterized protein LOC100371638 [Saccoglossus kowalevskii]|uniref:peptide-O-fucosyltransferase n=1 Tax=Saccoglossus kowalevskii TaxID=10224 RepID=A0ABM0GX45_SACKO|nr:PREDICTED: uncharacterized protein LOC100371638 [Saccoglossus kowalevskii]
MKSLVKLKLHCINIHKDTTRLLKFYLLIAMSGFLCVFLVKVHNNPSLIRSIDSLQFSSDSDEDKMWQMDLQEIMTDMGLKATTESPENLLDTGDNMMTFTFAAQFSTVVQDDDGPYMMTSKPSIPDTDIQKTPAPNDFVALTEDELETKGTEDDTFPPLIIADRSNAEEMAFDALRLSQGDRLQAGPLGDDQYDEFDLGADANAADMDFKPIRLDEWLTTPNPDKNKAPFHEEKYTTLSPAQALGGQAPFPALPQNVPLAYQPGGQAVPQAMPQSLGNQMNVPWVPQAVPQMNIPGVPQAVPQAVPQSLDSQMNVPVVPQAYSQSEAKADVPQAVPYDQPDSPVMPDLEIMYKPQIPIVVTEAPAPEILPKEYIMSKGQMVDVKEFRPRYLFPMFRLGVGGPNYQFNSLKTAIGFAIKHGRTLVISPFFPRHMINIADRRLFNETFDLVRLSNIVPIASVAQFKADCESTVGVVVHGPPVTKGKSSVTYDQVYETVRIRLGNIFGMKFPGKNFVPKTETESLNKIVDSDKAKCLGIYWPHNLGKLPAPVFNQDMLPRIDSHLKKIPSIQAMARVFIRLLFKGCQFMSVHWSLNEDVKKIWCEVMVPKEKRTACYTSPMPSHNISGILTSVMDKHQLDCAYAALSPDTMLGHMRDLSMSIKGIKTFNNIFELNTPYRLLLKSNEYLLSLVEQEISVRAKLFVGVSNSWWTYHVARERTAQGSETLYIHDFVLPSYLNMSSSASGPMVPRPLAPQVQIQAAKQIPNTGGQGQGGQGQGQSGGGGGGQEKKDGNTPWKPPTGQNQQSPWKKPEGQPQQQSPWKKPEGQPQQQSPWKPPAGQNQQSPWKKPADQNPQSPWKRPEGQDQGDKKPTGQNAGNPWKPPAGQNQGNAWKPQGQNQGSQWKPPAGQTGNNQWKPQNEGNKWKPPQNQASQWKPQNQQQNQAQKQWGGGPDGGGKGAGQQWW